MRQLLSLTTVLIRLRPLQVRLHVRDGEPEQFGSLHQRNETLCERAVAEAFESTRRLLDIPDDLTDEAIAKYEAVAVFAKESTTQKDLKNRVGDRLKADGDLKSILKERRRCWQLLYGDRFHLDVLPAIPDAERPGTSIFLTDRELVRWQFSNPIGYRTVY